MSAPLSGHGLIREGAPFRDDGSMMIARSHGTGGTGRGMCSCGALSEVLTSGNQRKAWHRKHKDEVRAAK